MKPARLILATLAVVITVRMTTSTTCPTPVRQTKPVRQADGSYVLPAPTTISALACFETLEWQEEWTAPPEDGGRFIRLVEKVSAP